MINTNKSLIAIVAIIAIMPDLPLVTVTGPDGNLLLGTSNHLEARNLINRISAETPATPFHFTMTRLLEKLEGENRVVAFDDASAIPRLAWADRNLMELRILLRFVCQSKSNLERFNNDILAIAPRTVRVLLSLESEDDAKMKVPNSMKANHNRLLAELELARNKAGLEANSQPLLARTCAAQVGLEREYLVCSSVTSPLVHPSALVVLKTVDLESYRPLLTSLGLKLAGNAIMDARAHIGKYGVKPMKFRERQSSGLPPERTKRNAN
jgi:hypothetical protein